jgi:hypothetical protein
MPETVPRSLVVITGVIAILAAFVGVRDYMGRKETPKPLASASVATPVQSNSGTARRKTNSAKTRHPRRSSTEANTATGLAAADLQKPTIGENSVKPDVIHDASANTIPDTSTTVREQLAENDANAPWSLACLPLPNSTKPGDVDANYYQDWAKEYGCKLK